MNENKGTLFSEFKPVSREEWKQKILEDLKGADFDKKMVWKPVEGFELQPFYLQEDLQNLDYLQHYHNTFFNKQKDGSPRSWNNLEYITVNDAAEANRFALEALQMGANGLILEVTQVPDFEKLLKAIDLSKIEIVLHTASNPMAVTEAYLNEVKRKGTDPSKVQGRLVFDPLAQLAVTGEKATEGVSILAKLIQATAAYPEFRVLTVNSTHFYDAGASENQELAFALNTAVEYIDQLTEKGISAADIVKNLSFSLAVGTNYFFEIAKLRALRVLFHQVTSLYGLQHHPGDLKIHSVSAIWSKTIYDPYVNMLRNTTEAMAAIIGGCDSISIRPFDDIFQTPNAFSRRIARNISTMLKEESYFDKVVDPAAGSYYLETITDKLIENSWNLFLEIEKSGGFSQSLASGSINQKIEAVKKEKINRVAGRRDILVGVNQYPNQTELLDPDKISLQQYTANGKTLKIERAAEAFEKLRLRTDKHVKQAGIEKRPKVFLSLIGDNAVMRKARAAFSAGFLGCAGFKIEESSPSASLDEALAKAEAAKASIVVICGADEDYTSGDAATFTSKLKATRKDTLIILAGYPAEHLDTLKAAGVDEFIHLKADLLGTLTRLQDKLGIQQNK